MSTSLYWLLLLVIDGVILFMGLNLIFGFIPNQLCRTSYHLIANVQLGLFIVVGFTYVYITYYRAIRRLDDFYSDDVRSHISWIVRCISLFIGLAIIAAVSPFSRHYSMWLSAAYLIFELGVYSYIYWRSRKYEMTAFALTFAKITEDEEFIEPTTTEQPTTLSPEVFQTIKSGVDEWISKRGYASQGVSLKYVAAQICTNRTYLSTYINMTYKCSFKVWITGLRIEEAKRLLCDSKTYSIGEVASRVGFASASSFVHIFRKIEGDSPSKWGETNRNSGSQSV